jgi:hypothetical protein
VIRAGDWPSDRSFGSRGIGGNERVGLDLPPQRPAVLKADSRGAGANLALAALVRQWLRASEQVEWQAPPEAAEPPSSGSRSTPSREQLPDKVCDLASMANRSPCPESVDTAAPVDLAVGEAGTPPAVPHPALPGRRRQPPPRPACRLAVLIDAEATTAESADALFDVLAELGTVSVCRAYADWTSHEARGWWSSTLRQHRIQPYHHCGHDHDQRSLVALTIDAVDLARESAVDAVVLVGDLVSVRPLVERLNASGLQVLAFGPTSTPDDVKALCQEFVNLSSLGHVGSGKHRA